MIYADSSALLKLVIAERETAALRSWLSDRDETTVVSSEVAKVEVLRGARRNDESAVPKAQGVIEDVDLLPLSRSLLDTAADVGQPALRSLDAIHLASALSIRDVLTVFVAYDSRLLEAARIAGLPVASPGPDP